MVRGSQFWLQELRYDPQQLPAYAEVIMIGKDTGQNCLSRIRATIYCSRSGGPADVSPIFKMGIVTAGLLQLSGSLEILGNLHANQGFSIDPSSVVEQLKQNQFTVTQSLDPMRPDYRPFSRSIGDLRKKVSGVPVYSTAIRKSVPFGKSEFISFR